MKKYLAEAIGTFCLVFMGTGAIVVNEVSHGQVTHVGISLTFGLVVLAMIYAVGHISGAHLNPAVTLGFFSSGRLEARFVLPYVTAQLAGAVAASATLNAMFSGSSLGITLPSGTLAQSFVMEFILTAVLMFVILGVATEAREEGILAGVAIGSTIALEALVGGPISGASMNPARSFGPALLTGHFVSHWVYWIAPLLGSMTGAWAQKFLQS
jgi:MIP family channel proteins